MLTDGHRGDISAVGNLPAQQLKGFSIPRPASKISLKTNPFK